MKPSYYDLTPTEAQDNFDRLVGIQPEWAEKFASLAGRFGIALDYSIESIEPAWQFVLDFDGETGFSDPDPWMVLDPYVERNISAQVGWRVGLFAAYWYVVLSRYTDTKWFLGNKNTQYATALNQPILQVGSVYGDGLPAGNFCSAFLRGTPAKAIADLANRQVREARSTETAGSEPLYEAERFHDDVNLTYCEEILHSDEYHPFLDQVHELFVQRFGPGMYLEDYDGSFYVEEPSNIAETLRIVTEIAEQAGDPR